MAIPWEAEASCLRAYLFYFAAPLATPWEAEAACLRAEAHSLRNPDINLPLPILMI